MMRRELLQYTVHNTDYRYGVLYILYICKGERIRGDHVSYKQKYEDN